MQVKMDKIRMRHERSVRRCFGVVQDQRGGGAEILDRAEAEGVRCGLMRADACGQACRRAGRRGRAAALAFGAFGSVVLKHHAKRCGDRTMRGGI